MQVRFSQRYGHSPVKQVIQLESMDSDLRISLWNALELEIWGALCSSYAEYLDDSRNDGLRRICAAIWADFFKNSLHELPYRWRELSAHFREFFSSGQWYEIYDFVEFIVQLDTSNTLPENLQSRFSLRVNGYLQREVAGYRLVNGLIVPIVDQNEIEELETAISAGVKSVSKHLSRALQLMSDRQNPDYRNSVKESISAVEGQVLWSLNQSNGTLGDLLNQLDRKAPIHPAFKDAFSKLYGYTSDEGGIRHALMEESREVTFEEATFMLVACSAFVNYVRGSG